MNRGDRGLPRFLEGFSRFTQWLVGGLFVLLGAVSVVNGVFFYSVFDSGRYYSLALTFVGTALLFALYLWGGQVFQGLERRGFFLWAVESRLLPPLGLAALMGLSLAARLYFVFGYHVNPEVDYYTLYHAGELLSQQFDLSALDDYTVRYMALFPHIFGYGSFLSLVFGVFGVSVKAACAANAVLSTLALGLLYYIGWKLSGRWVGFLAALLWCCYPSQILFNMQVTSDPYYTTLLIASAAVLIALREKAAQWAWWKLALGGGLVGLLLALVNSARPVAAIFVIAAAVVLFVIEPLCRKGCRGKKGALFLAMCLLFLLGNAGNNWLFTQRIGEAPASVPGFNLLVGFNPDSNGKWNEADAALLSQWDQSGISAKEVQDAMLDAALERITSGEVDFARLFWNKLATLWEADDSGASYAQAALPHLWLYVALSNSYYYLLWILATGGVWSLLRRRGKSLWYLFPLYVVGLTMAHLLAEVAQRYHYSGNFCLALLAALGLEALGQSSWRRWKTLEAGRAKEALS